MTSSFFDTLTKSRKGSDVLPFYEDTSRKSSTDYAMERLDPRPDDRYQEDDLAPERFSRRDYPSDSKRPLFDANDDRSSSVGSYSKLKPPHMFSRPPMFAGPPPPIAASMVMRGSPSRSPSNRRESPRPGGASLIQTGRANVKSVLFDASTPHVSQSSDTTWRWLQRREKTLEDDVQRLLDLQAAGLLAGLGAPNALPYSESEGEGQSDTGSSTPTGTFYSTASSKSRMVNSLYVPARSNAEGNVIPVRQPSKGRQPGLRSARRGLGKIMTAFTDLKQEEDAHIDDALSRRRKALLQLNRLRTRRDGITGELDTLEHDEEEPLGQEMRQLGVEHDTISEEIRIMEEKLVGMRNRRRWIREKMNDVKDKREAGLSGYRGALQDVDSKVAALMHRPPVEPLDPELLAKDDIVGQHDADAPGGAEFLRLIPERRTVDMASSWWEEEIAVLERRKAQIATDKQALEEGGSMWKDVAALVTTFETSLKQIMKTGSVTDSSGPSAKGKEKAPSQEHVVRDQVARMGEVLKQLEQQMEVAEQKRWNLLICAIGAELEAFKEAHEMLRDLVDGSQEGTAGESQDAAAPETKSQDAPDESDNEVPPDLLVSHAEEHRAATTVTADADDAGRGLERVESENEVPPEFLGGTHDASSNDGHGEDRVD